MIEIRAATRSDLPAILEVYAEIESGGTATPLAQAENLFDRMQQYPDYKIYIAVEGGAIIGSFALLIMDNLAHGGMPSGIVEDVAVRASHQGRGIGKQMMQFAMQQCRSAGCYKLSLSSNLKREAAHSFYDSLGFVRHGYSFLVELANKI